MKLHSLNSSTQTHGDVVGRFSLVYSLFGFLCCHQHENLFTKLYAYRVIEFSIFNQTQVNGKKSYFPKI